MSIIPGTQNANPKLLMPLVSIQIEKIWQIATVIKGQKHEETFLINQEKILSTKVLLRIKFTPNIIDTQKIDTKFYEVNIPKTPLCPLNVNSFPPKQQPQTIKLIVRHMLQMSKLENLGVLGIQQWVQKYKIAKEPRMARISPLNRLREEQDKQKAKGLFVTGKLQESQQIIIIAIINKSTPAIQLQQQTSFFRNLPIEMKKNFSLRKQNVWAREVSLPAIVPNMTYTQQLIEKMKCFCKFYRVSKLINFSLAFLVFLCSYKTKGMSNILVVNTLHADLVKLSQLISTVIQQGTTALLMALKIKIIQANKELIYMGCSISSFQSTIDIPLEIERVDFTLIEYLLDSPQLLSERTCYLSLLQ